MESIRSMLPPKNRNCAAPYLLYASLAAVFLSASPGIAIPERVLADLNGQLRTAAIQGDERGRPEASIRPAYSNEVAEIQDEMNRTRNVEAALTRIQELLKREPNNTEAHMLCGKILNHLGYESLADEQFEIVDKLDPTQPQSALSLFQSKLRTEGFQAAYEYLRYVQMHFPYDPSVLVVQGMVERMKGNDLKAEFFYKDAIRRYPNTPGLNTTLAALRMKQHRYADAVKLANKDLELKKDHPAAALVKGEALLEIGQAKEAISALKIAYNDRSADRKEVSEKLSRAYMVNGQYTEALEPTLTYLAFLPMTDHDHVDQVKRRMTLLLTQASPSELLNAAQLVVREIDDTDRQAYIWFACGDILDKAGYKKDAEVAFSRGLKLRPETARAYLRIAKIKEEEGDRAGSFAFYLYAYSNDKDGDPVIQSAVARRKQRDLSAKSDLAARIKDWLRSMIYGIPQAVPDANPTH